MNTSADAGLSELRNFMREDTRANILMAAGDLGEFEFQRLTLAQTLSEEFRESIQWVVDDEYLLHKYEPGYKPDDDELCYLPVEESSLVNDVIEGISRFDSAALFREDDQVIDSLRFYAIILDNKKKQALFFREFNRKKELTKSGLIPVMSEKGTFTRVTRKIFLFDDDVDCFSWDGYLFIRSVSAFQRIFGYFEELIRKAERTIRSVVVRIPIANVDDFANACRTNPRMLSKLSQIAAKPYIKTLTMTDVKRVIADFGIDVKIVQDAGVEKLVFERSPAKRWNILKLLDDDFLNSMMTNLKYASNSKSQI